MTIKSRSLIIGTSLLALAACGPEEISSPGTGGDIIINNPPAPTPAPAPTPTPGPTPTPTGVTAAASCPTINATGGLSDGGVVTVPNGTVRVCALPLLVDASSTLPTTPDNAKVIFEIPSLVEVGTDGGPAPDNSDGADDDDVVLTIEAGVVLFGGTGNSALLVNRGNQINAVGNSGNPIIFTSEQNILGSTTDDSDRQWGGVILLGRAPTADCDGSADGGTVDCEQRIEGLAVDRFFGGATDNDDSGTMSFVQIRYSGFPLSGDDELQSLTTGGTGLGTTLNNIQTVNSSDDGVEFFGGFINLKNLVVIGAADDSIDTDSGVQANLQWVIAVQRANTGNGLLEIDSGSGEDDFPRQDLRISNATFVARSNASDAAAWRTRAGGADLSIANSLLVLDGYTQACLTSDGPAPLQAAGNYPSTNRAAGDTPDNGPPFFASVFMDCNGNSYHVNGQETALEAAFNSNDNGTFSHSGGLNKDDDYTSTLNLVFANGTNENGFTVFDPTAFNRNGFSFDVPTFVGASNGSSTWFNTWTCNSSIANLGGGSNCADSPV